MRIAVNHGTSKCRGKYRIHGALGRVATAPREETSPSGPKPIRWLPAFLAAALVLSTLETRAQDLLRIGTSGDYTPFSVWVEAGKGSPHYAGFGPELARAYARDRGLSPRFIAFRWPELMRDLEAGRFDVAMSGITVRPERSLAGRFTSPVARSGAVALVPNEAAITSAADLNAPGVRVSVNAGGHLERTARKKLPRATIIAVADNRAVMAALKSGSVEAVITDTREAPHWQAEMSGLRVVGPFTRDYKALWVRSDLPDLARDLDAWLLARELDGQMSAWRAQHLGDAPESESHRPVLDALLAAMAERLALMPLVAEAKRHAGSPVEVPEREVRVIAAALGQVRETESANGVEESQRLPAPAVRQFFTAQIEAAKAIQRAVLAEPAPAGEEPPVSLEDSLRPALLRIGDRIARLIVRLPPGIPAQVIGPRSEREFSGLGLPQPRIDALARGIASLRPEP